MIKRLEKLIKLKKIKTLLIVAPSAVVFNWKLEINKFIKNPSEKMVAVNWGDASKKQREDCLKELLELRKKDDRVQVILINYEKIALDKKLLLKFDPDMLIVDESQKVKSRNAQVSKALRIIAKRCTYRYLLTGTPMSTGYEDYYSQFLIMDDRVFGTRWADFENTYCQKGGYMGKEIVGYKNVKMLKRKIRANSFIVKKKDCLDLPPVVEQRLYCELGSKARKAYNELDKELITEVNGLYFGVEGNSPFKVYDFKSILDGVIKDNLELDKKDLIALDNALTKTMKLQQITGGFIKNTETEETLLVDSNKLNLLLSTVEEYPKPLVIFCRFRAEIDTIKQFLKRKKYRVAELSGKTKSKEGINKGEVVQRFQEGKYDILVVQLKTGSAGINLTRASTAIYYSWSSSYMDMEQSKARLDRIGQQGEAVNLLYLVAKNTIDETSLKVLEKRKTLDERILK